MIKCILEQHIRDRLFTGKEPDDQQGIDYIEARDGKMWACEMKWSSK